MLRIVPITIGKTKKINYYTCTDIDITVGDYCIVDSDRTQECGKAIALPRVETTESHQKQLRRVIRKAQAKDLARITQNKKDAKKAYAVCEEKNKKSKLAMRIVDVEYTFDKGKIVCYYTANNRVDFRHLVKDMAAYFHIRIELRQIGPREKAKVLGGLGRCGRTLCCKSFLKNITPVSVKTARSQGITGKASQMTGVCGQLLCCLKYEAAGKKKESGCAKKTTGESTTTCCHS